MYVFPRTILSLLRHVVPYPGTRARAERLQHWALGVIAALALTVLGTGQSLAESAACTALNASQWAAGHTETTPAGTFNIDTDIIGDFDPGETINWSASSSGGGDDGNLGFSIATFNDLWDEADNAGGNFVTSGSEIVGSNPGDGELWITWVVDAVTSPVGSVTIQVTCTPVIAAPSLTNIAPNMGPTAGGTVVTITGTDLTGATAVAFGGTPATSFTVDSSTQITATTPPHTAGAVDVVVTTPDGSGTLSGGYTYVIPVPALTSVTPNTGTTSGGTSVTIGGTGLTGASSVTFDGTPATAFTVDSDGQITATTPPHAAGAVDVEVTTPGGADTLPDGFTYVAIPAPTISDISPDTGPASGGTVVTVTGTDLAGATAVTFGGTPAASFTVNSPTQITATTPAHAAGPVDVAVSTLAGTATVTNGFTYEGPVLPDPSQDPEVIGLLQSQTSTAARLAQSQTRNFRNRLEQLHRESDRRNSSIDIRFGYGPNAATNAASQQIDEMIAASHAAAGGAIARRGVLAYSPEQEPLPTLEPDFGPLALWTGGFVNFGARDGGLELNHLLVGVSGGVDYRFSDTFVGGIGIGYGRDRTDIGSNGTESTGSAYSAAIYGSFEPVEGLFIDGLIGGSLLAFDSRRFVTATGDFATGSRSGSQLFGSLSAAYEVRDEAWLISPYGRVEMARSWLAGFTESGGGIYGLTYGEQTVDTLSGIIGIRASHAFGTDWGTVTPGVRAEYSHDFQGTSQARLGYTDLGTLPYIVDTGPDGRDRVTIGLSLDLDFAGGASLGIDYSTSFAGAGNLDHAVGVNLSDRF